jgi:hypothetical protein
VLILAKMILCVMLVRVLRLTNYRFLYHLAPHQSLCSLFTPMFGVLPDSFGNKKCYVSFIDDFSKFTWIYLLRHIPEVSKYFFEFQKLVECLLDRKIVAV